MRVKITPSSGNVFCGLTPSPHLGFSEKETAQKKNLLAIDVNRVISPSPQ